MQPFQKANITDPVVRADTSIAFMEGSHVVSFAQAIKALRVANINILSSDQFDTTSAPFFPVNFSPFWNQNIKIGRTIDAASAKINC